MSKHYALKAEARERAGKGVARELRRQKQIPAVIYGDGKEPISISLPEKEITLEHRKGHMFTNLCDLEVGAAKHLVLARDVQLDPVTDKVLHVDFLRVSNKTKIAVRVPLHFINEEECPGLNAKGVLNIAYHDLVLSCLATDIPEHLEIDLTPYNIGDAIKLSTVKMPKGVSLADKGRHDVTIATIVEPKAYVELEVVDPVGDEAAAGEADKADAEKKDE
ncbi:MAG: 50S ribosomal protein L25/general stress protein Ctc [Alphaproteobacteria bacterium]|nr:50S ribosomal protein L25/general stress protein Ctc [Alphaproteobacteria bacterium]MBU0859582.1 50S ribosomal protein L25/general stress protein Ctc [Alphaproteobacteria bacterium]